MNIMYIVLLCDPRERVVWIQIRRPRAPLYGCISKIWSKHQCEYIYSWKMCPNAYLLTKLVAYL